MKHKNNKVKVSISEQEFSEQMNEIRINKEKNTLLGVRKVRSHMHLWYKYLNNEPQKIEEETVVRENIQDVLRLLDYLIKCQIYHKPLVEIEAVFEDSIISWDKSFEELGEITKENPIRLVYEHIKIQSFGN